MVTCSSARWSGLAVGLPDLFTRGLGCLSLRVELGVLDRCPDEELPDVDAPSGHLGAEGLQVVALGGLGGAGPAQVREAPNGAGALGGQDRAIPALEHGGQELLHERYQGVHGQRQVGVETLGSQDLGGDEPAGGRGSVIDHVEVAHDGADLLREAGDGGGVGQVGGDDVRGGAARGQVVGQALERFPAPGDEDDAVPVMRVAMGDRLAEAGSGPKTPMDLPSV
jgi:hypothetical protein